MKRYRKNNTEVEAIQYDGSIESFNEIKDSIDDDKKDKFIQEEGIRGELVFNVMCKKRYTIIHNTDWIVKDGKYYFVVSNDIFEEMFTEI